MDRELYLEEPMGRIPGTLAVGDHTQLGPVRKQGMPEHSTGEARNLQTEERRPGAKERRPQIEERRPGSGERKPHPEDREARPRTHFEDPHQ